MALFKKAAPATGGAKKKSTAPIFVAADVVDPDGKTIFTKEQVKEAITGFAQGKELEKQGQALMETHRPALSEFGRRNFCRVWASTGSPPSSSPKLTTNEAGTGTMITMSFVDRQMNLTDDQYAHLSNVIGPKNAEEAVERYTQYTIDAKLAAREETINGEKATIQDHIEKALMAYFPEDKHDLLGEMLKPKDVFQTKKGIIQRGLDFVGRGSPTAALKLAEFLVSARVIQMFKPGAVGEDD